MNEPKQNDISLDIAKIFIHGLMNERGSLIAATLGQCSPETIEQMTETAAKWIRPYVEALPILNVQSFWMNKKNLRPYEVLGDVINATNGIPTDKQEMVLYRRVGTKMLFVRELTEFALKFAQGSKE